MKNLFQKLSNNSEFFNEKRFVFQDMPRRVFKGSLEVSGSQKRLKSIDTSESPSDKVKKAKEEAARAEIRRTKELSENSELRAQKNLLKEIEHKWVNYKDKIVDAYNNAKAVLLSERGASSKVKARGEEMAMGYGENINDLIPNINDLYNRFQSGRNLKILNKSLVEYHVYKKNGLTEMKNNIVDSVVKKVLPKGFKQLIKPNIRRKIKKTILAAARIRRRKDAIAAREKPNPK